MRADKKYDCGVYAITHIPSGKKYIGSSYSINRRLQDHRSRLEKNKHDNERLQHAWNKYGGTNFSFDKIIITSREDRLYYEQLLMDGYVSSHRNSGFNISLLASHPKHSEETRVKISQTRAKARAEGRIGGHFTPHTEESKKKMSATRKGVPTGRKTIHSEETRRKMSVAHKGKKAWNKNVPMTPEAREKLSKSQKERLNTHEWKTKLALTRKTHCKYGHPYSGENLYITPRGGRECKKCAYNRLLKHRSKYPRRKGS